MCTSKDCLYLGIPQEFWAIDLKKGVGREAWYKLWYNTDLYNRSLTSSPSGSLLISNSSQFEYSRGMWALSWVTSVKVLDLPFHSPVVRMLCISKWVNPVNRLLGG